jgi:glyoxylate/hydroxypyruvate reductase
MRMFVALDLDAAQTARLRTIAGDHGLIVHGGTSGNEPFPATLRGCEVAFGNLPAAWLVHAQMLRWMQLESVGFGDYLDLPNGLVGGRLAITNLAGFFSIPVAESILAGILALHRGVDRLARLQFAGEWRGDALRPTLRTLGGQTVVLFGSGSIGRRLEDLLAPFDCTVLPFDSTWTSAELDRALARADVVVATAPDTPGTRGVFDRRRIAAIRKGAIFVNFGRGSLVDEAALHDALHAGHLAGAVLDVTPHEPLPTDHPFWSCPGLLLTQHTGGGAAEELDRKIDVFQDNLARYRKGQPLRGLINLDRGY